MEQAQIEQLGSKMRDAYNDVASEPVPTPGPKRASRRLRKSPTFGHAEKRHVRSSGGSLVVQHPIASLLTAAAIGYVLARL
jgi:hypothetical protein